VRVSSEVVDMPDPNVFFGRGAAKRILTGREEDARKAKDPNLASEENKLLEKYPSKAMRLPTDHLDYPGEHNSNVRDFVNQHKEAGIKAVITHILDKGTELPEDAKGKITDHFVKDYQGKISESPTLTDFFSCFTEASVGDISKKHVDALPAGHPKRTVIAAVVSNPEPYIATLKRALRFSSLSSLLPDAPKK